MNLQLSKPTKNRQIWRFLVGVVSSVLKPEITPVMFNREERAVPLQESDFTPKVIIPGRRNISVATVLVHEGRFILIPTSGWLPQIGILASQTAAEAASMALEADLGYGKGQLSGCGLLGEVPHDHGGRTIVYHMTLRPRVQPVAGLWIGNQNQFISTWLEAEEQGNQVPALVRDVTRALAAKSLISWTLG